MGSANPSLRWGLALIAALATTSCASKLSYDLGKAEDVCHARHFPTKTALDQCLATQERPVWSKDEPQTLDLYDAFAAQRAKLAQQYDQHALSQDQYETALRDLGRRFRADVTARRETLENEQHPPAPAPTPPPPPATSSP